MSRIDNEYIKVVQAVIMPDTVEALNVFYFTTQFQQDQTDLAVTTILGDWIELIYGAIDGNISDTCAIGLMRAYFLASSTPVEWTKFGELTPDVTFADITEMLPHGVSALIRGYTTRAKTIGRKYFPGYAEDAQEDGAWVSGAISNLVTASLAWGNTAAIDVDNRLVPGVFSTTLKLVYELTDEFVIPAFPGYQRRRRPGVGS